jgi:hypothetical protein
LQVTKLLCEETAGENKNEQIEELVCCVMLEFREVVLVSQKPDAALGRVYVNSKASHNCAIEGALQK